MRPGHQKSLTQKKNRWSPPRSANLAHHQNNPVTLPPAPLSPDTKWGKSRGAGGMLPTALPGAGGVDTNSFGIAFRSWPGSDGLRAARMAQILTWISAGQGLFQLHISGRGII